MVAMCVWLLKMPWKLGLQMNNVFEEVLNVLLRSWHTNNLICNCFDTCYSQLIIIILCKPLWGNSTLNPVWNPGATAVGNRKKGITVSFLSPWNLANMVVGFHVSGCTDCIHEVSEDTCMIIYMYNNLRKMDQGAIDNGKCAMICENSLIGTSLSMQNWLTMQSGLTMCCINVCFWDKIWLFCG